MPRTYHGRFKCEHCGAEFRYYYRRSHGIERNPAECLTVHLAETGHGKEIRLTRANIEAAMRGDY